MCRWDEVSVYSHPDIQTWMGYGLRERTRKLVKKVTPGSLTFRLYHGRKEDEWGNVTHNYYVYLGKVMLGWDRCTRKEADAMLKRFIDSI